jgi:hypothetical protein
MLSATDQARLASLGRRALGDAVEDGQAGTYASVVRQFVGGLEHAVLAGQHGLGGEALGEPRLGLEADKLRRGHHLVQTGLQLRGVGGVRFEIAAHLGAVEGGALVGNAHIQAGACLGAKISL